jgi:signal transduction histidine kinase
MLPVEGGRQVLQTFIRPVKSVSGLVGGIMIAKSVNDQLLQKFTAGSYKDLIVMRNGQMVSTTLSSIRRSTAINITDIFAPNLTINNQRYLSKSISFMGASQAISVIVLSPIAQLDAAKNLLWIRFGFVFLFGSVVVVVVGFLTSEAITRPLKIVSQVAKKVTEDNNFKLQVPVITKDEIGVVAISLNQLIHQVRELLIEQQESKEQLEIYNQTLEEQVANRTEEIHQKNIDLQKTLHQLKDAQLQLVQSEKMSALGQLVAGVAHEINNPVNFIHGNLTYIDEYTQDLIRLLKAYQTQYPHPSQSIKDDLEEVNLDFLREDLAKILKSMKFGSDRIRDIVLSLRNFSRLDEAEFKPIDIHQGIDNTLMILQHRLKATKKRPAIEVIKEYGDLPLVECSAGQLNQVFMNLLSNAIDAVEERQQQLSFQDLEKNPNRIVISTSKSPSNSVQIKIADNGLGISEEVRSRLFDPFFTTKPVGKGTGLGLSISYQVVTETHGGKIWCDSVISKGTSFFVELPVSP